MKASNNIRVEEVRNGKGSELLLKLNPSHKGFIVETTEGYNVPLRVNGIKPSDQARNANGQSIVNVALH